MPTPRVTETEVLAIMDNDLAESDVTVYLAPATLLVDAKLADSGLPDEHIKEIEKWLAAHFVAVAKDRQAKSEKIGEITVTYTGSDGLHLDSTPYGQQALALDITGALSRKGGAPIFEAISQ